MQRTSFMLKVSERGALKTIGNFKQRYILLSDILVLCFMLSVEYYFLMDPIIGSFIQLLVKVKVKV